MIDEFIHSSRCSLLPEALSPFWAKLGNAISSTLSWYWAHLPSACPFWLESLRGSYYNPPSSPGWWWPESGPCSVAPMSWPSLRGRQKLCLGIPPSGPALSCRSLGPLQVRREIWACLLSLPNLKAGTKTKSQKNPWLCVVNIFRVTIEARFHDLKLQRAGSADLFFKQAVVVVLGYSKVFQNVI